MNKFLKKAIVFICITSILVLFVFIASLKFINHKAQLKINHEQNQLLMGHSHSECAFNDSIITRMKNVSQSGESYFYTYSKLKYLLEQNNHIDTVFIEFSNNQIDIVMNSWIWEGRYMMKRLPTYLPFLDIEDLKILRNNNQGGFVAALSKSFRRNLIRIGMLDFNFSDEIGGYRRLERNKIDSLIMARKVNDTVKTDNFKMSVYSLKYLMKCIEYCKDKGVEVILVRSPQHKYFSYATNESQFLRVKDSLFSNVKFMDFNNFPINDDEFGDFGHLNYKGSNKFSKAFNSFNENKLEDSLLVKYFK
ncbi:hypothetical protein ACOCEA_16585 [Maribacter sp. CXY002]|uniref:hypothetical protein n=1 Tax=Maribacter luteocoastalis TaxID=3407671 RepID=UPI003B66CB35